MGTAHPSVIKTENAGMTRCLGLDCGEMFWSPDKINTRFCKKCRHKSYRSTPAFSFQLHKPRRRLLRLAS